MNNFGTRLFLEAFHEYITDNNIKLTDENIHEVTQEFIKIYNQGRKDIMDGKREKTDEEKVFELIDEAQMTESRTKAKKLLNKALEIDPESIPAKVTLISVEEEYAFNRIDPLLALQKKEQARLEYYQRESRRVIDNYYLDIAGRDYLIILTSLFHTYLVCGMNTKAIELGHYILELDPGNHHVIHEDLIRACIQIEDYENAQELIDGYAEETPAKLFFESILLFKMGELKEAKACVEKICVKYPNIKKFMAARDMEQTFINLQSTGKLDENIIEFMEVTSESEQLLNDTEAFDFMITTMKAYKKQPKKKEKPILN